ncbi:peptidoglycan editing factor PgeF [Nocardioides stalactiti]|uniref:peptidoglycan editing factor PgeF n=1 Tax=Nocardioides stalactiti TaxID=2755356 RepID=UPI00160441EC|nr:peptidoglycan editing factor PgeF [Nocardioides stalactiti]
MYSFRTTSGPVELAFTDRLGGVSVAPYDELDLALEGDDVGRARTENHRLLLADFAPDDELCDLHQVHGATVALIEDDEPTSRPDADGIVTTGAGRTLMVRAADCVPVLLADPGARVIGAAHAGRLGVVRGVVPATVERMRDVGARDLVAWIGPHICGGCYEVPAAMQAEVVAAEPATRATTTWGTPALDLGAGVAAQLERAGVSVQWAARCTRESTDLFSFRRDGEHAGRLAGVIRLSPAGAER